MILAWLRAWLCEPWLRAWLSVPWLRAWLHRGLCVAWLHEGLCVAWLHRSAVLRRIHRLWLHSRILVDDSDSWLAMMSVMSQASYAFIVVTLHHRNEVDPEYTLNCYRKHVIDDDFSPIRLERIASESESENAAYFSKNPYDILLNVED